MAGLFDFEWLKTPEGQGLLGAVAGYAANAQRGAPINSLGRGGLAGLLAFGQATDRQDRMAQEAQERDLRGLKLTQLRSELNRQQLIQDGLRKLSQEQGTANRMAAIAPQLDLQPADEYGTAGLGGIPLYSAGGAARQASAPAVTYNQLPQGAAHGAAPRQSLPARQFPATLGGSQGNYTQGLSNRFLKQAEVYATNGDIDTANKLYEQAAKWMPEVHKIEVAMHQGQPVNVITLKDGNQVISPFAPTPKVHWADNGGSIIPVDEYTVRPMGNIRKTMTPGETATNQVAWANHRNSVERLDFDRLQAGKPQFHEGAWHVPPSAANPQGAVIQPQLPPAGTPKLTEVQANATQFATRMRDAAGVIDQLESGGAPWPSTVARAGYDPQFPSWMPGGQVMAGAVRGINNVTVPEDAQRYHQAQQNWVSANLRKESGAAIGVQEMQQEIRKWFPQPGDGPDVIAQKAAARKVAEEAMLTQAGPGAREVPSILRRAQGGQSGGGGTADWRYENGKLVKVK